MERTSTMLRSTLAVLGGYATMAALVVAATAALARLWPSSTDEEDSPTTAYTAVNLTYGSLFAAVGGYVTSALAGALHWATPSRSLCSC